MRVWSLVLLWSKSLHMNFILMSFIYIICKISMLCGSFRWQFKNFNICLVSITYENISTDFNNDVNVYIYLEEWRPFTILHVWSLVMRSNIGLEIMWCERGIYLKPWMNISVCFIDSSFLLNIINRNFIDN